MPPENIEREEAVRVKIVDDKDDKWYATDGNYVYQLEEGGVYQETRTLSVGSVWGGKQVLGEIRTFKTSKNGIEATETRLSAYLFRVGNWTLNLAKDYIKALGLRESVSVADTGRPQLHPSFRTILEKFVKKYGSVEGLRRFSRFTVDHGVDTSRDYRAQGIERSFKESIDQGLAESFGWVSVPIIQLVKSDSDARWFKIIALNAGTSMNNNPYPLEKFPGAAESAEYRPISLNHREYLEYPASRTQFTHVEDGAIECLARISNKRSDVQKKIADHEILSASIEAVPKNPKSGPEGGFIITALSLIEKTRGLPGDPLSTVEPLVLTEAISAEACRLVSPNCWICGSASDVAALQESITELKAEVESLQRKVDAPPIELKQVERRLKQSLAIIKKSKQKRPQLYRDVKT